MKMSRRQVLIILNIILLTFLTHVYFITRYDFNWLEWDTATTTRSIVSMQSEAILVPTRAYPAGFSYEFIASSASSIMDVDIQTLQQIVFPITYGVVPVLIAICFYRSMLKGKHDWIASSLLLILIPEFIMVSSRGTHEKSSMILIMTLLLMVAIWIRRNNISSRPPIPFIAAAFVMISAIVFTNCFFAVSFFIVLAIAQPVAVKLGEIKRSRDFLSIPLFGLACTGAFLLLYRPASTLVATASTYWQKLALILSGQETPAEPYSSISAAWTSTSAWTATNLLTFFLIGFSAGYIAYSLLLKRNQESIGTTEALYLGATGMLLVFVILDYVGGSSISNLQLRWLPFWGITAAPAAYRGALLAGRTHLRSIPRRGLVLMLGLAIAIVLSLSLLRATLDPSISNRWIYYSDAEDYSIDWINQTCSGNAWGGIDYRTGSLFVFDHGFPQNPSLKFVTAENPSGLGIVLDSDLSALQADHLDLNLQSLASWNRVMDIGKASVLMD